VVNLLIVELAHPDIHAVMVPAFKDVQMNVLYWMHNYVQGKDIRNALTTMQIHVWNGAH